MLADPDGCGGYCDEPSAVVLLERGAFSFMMVGSFLVMLIMVMIGGVYRSKEEVT